MEIEKIKLSSEQLLEIAKQYINAGLCTLPATKEKKCPTISWKQYQNKIITDQELTNNFNSSINALAIICGEVSGNLEVIDFDNKGELLIPFRDLLDLKDSVISNKLVFESTQSGGAHIYYRCEQKIEGNLKLAMRGNQVLIETRGEGGLIICAPSLGYEMIKGDLLEIPLITSKERNLILSIARSLDETKKEEVYKKAVNPLVKSSYDVLPGDDFNNRGDPRPYLIELGWKCVKSGHNEHWCRPGKEIGISATLRENVFYVFSSSASPFEPNKTYSPFYIYTLARCDSDYKKASKELFDLGFGKRKENYQPYDSADFTYKKEEKNEVIKNKDEKETIEGIVEKILEKNDIISDTNCIIYLYDGKKWVEITQLRLKIMIIEIVGKNKFRPKLVNETLLMLNTQIHSKTPIVFNNIKDYEIPLQNGVFNLITKTLRVHNKQDMLLAYIETDYDKDSSFFDFSAQVSQWLENPNEKNPEKCLSEIHDMRSLQEFAGYCLMPRAIYKKALLIYGPPDTGKSLFLSIIREIIGNNNTCNIAIDKMDDPKALAPIKGKMLNFIGDLKKDSMLADGGFKTLVSGGDAIQIDEKFKPQQMIIPYAKHIIATNNLPVITDTTNAVYERLIFLNFKNIIKKDDRDPKILEKFLKFKSGILNWMIEGAVDIYNKNGYFTISDRQKENLNEYKESNNPIVEFLDEKYNVDENGFVAISDFRDKFREYSGNYRVSSKYTVKLLKDYGIECFKKRIDDRIIYGFLGYKHIDLRNFNAYK